LKGYFNTVRNQLSFCYNRFNSFVDIIVSV